MFALFVSTICTFPPVFFLNFSFRFPYDSYDFSLENLILDQQTILIDIFLYSYH